MTAQQFDNTGFRGSMFALYEGNKYPIITVDYKERLIGIDEQISGGEEGDVSWKRCENVEIVKPD